MGFPVALIEIYGEHGYFALPGGSPSGTRPLGDTPGSDLLRCHTQKYIGSPAGVFELTLTYEPDTQGRRWNDKIRPQDMVVIQMQNYQGRLGQRGAGEMHTVMIGFVDQITKETVLSMHGKPRRVITVYGRDAGKLFINGIITYWSFLGAALIGAASWIDPNAFNETPAQIVETLFQTIFRKFLKVHTLTGQQQVEVAEFADMLSRQLDSYPFKIPMQVDISLTVGEGSFWGMMQKVASPPFHELWVDTRRVADLSSVIPGSSLSVREVAPVTFGKDNSAPTLLMRPTPFPFLTPDRLADANDWSNLITHEIGVEDVIGEPFSDRMSVSDAEQFNLYLVLPQLPGLDEHQLLQMLPIVIDEPKLKRYGYKPFTPTTPLVMFPDQMNIGGAYFGFYRDFIWRLASWNVLNDQFESGQQTMKLQPHLHVGERLLDKSQTHKPMLYYIESIRHEWIVNERAMTTAGLTRGLPASQYDTIGPRLQATDLKEITPTDIIPTYRDLVNKGQEQPA